MAWLWLAMAGLCEVLWVLLLKYSDGFSRPAWSTATVISIGFSFYCMAQALRTLSMGTVYAVWTGIGAAGGIAWGIAMQGEPATFGRLACLGLIIAGIVGLRLIT